MLERIQRQHAAKQKNIILQVLDALLARSGMTAYIPIVFVTIAMFCGETWQIFLPITDRARYQCYALTFWLGSNATHLLPAAQCAFLQTAAVQPAFHMLPMEYPPLILVPFSLALFAPLPYYQLAFALLMSLATVLIYWALLRYGPRGSALIFAGYLFAGALATALGRFDLLPAALTLFCIIAAERKHWSAAYIALAFGVLLKLYPILLLPALFIAEQQARHRLYAPVEPFRLAALPREILTTLKGARAWCWKNTLLFLAVVASITGAFALLNFQGAVFSQISYFAGRPIQIEATGSTILWIAKHYGMPLQIASTFGSLNIVSPLDGVVGLGSELLFVAGYLYAIWLQWRGKLDIAQVSIALLLVFIATGKVFSPQYLIWLVPLLAYTGAFDSFWLICWGAISVLTTFVYTYIYTRPADPLQIPYVPGFFECITTRNAFFVLVTLAYLFDWFHVRRRWSLPDR